MGDGDGFSDGSFGDDGSGISGGSGIGFGDGSGLGMGGSDGGFGDGISGSGISFSDGGFGTPGFGESGSTGFGDGISGSGISFNDGLGFGIGLGMDSGSSLGLGFNSSLADFGLDAGMTADPGFSFNDASLSSFGTPGFNSNSDDNGFLGKFKGFLSSQAMNAALGKAGIPSGLAPGILGLGKAAITGDPNSAFNGFFSTAKGMALGALGPMGALAGLGISAMGPGGPNGQSGPAGFGGGGMSLNDILQGAAGLYMGNRAKGQYNQQLNTLNDLFSPNSPYAQQMKQTLERRDAASGRRSQYGNREVELAAALAQAQAGALTSPGYQQAMRGRQTAQNQGLNTMLALLGKNPQIGQSIMNGVHGMLSGGGLQSLFNNGYSDAWAMGPNAGPQLDFGGFGDEGALMDGGYWGG